MSRLIDDRGRLFGKVNVIDLIVLLAIVALALFVGLRSSDVSIDETEPVTITFIIQPNDSRMLDAYTELGTVTDMMGRKIGTIVEASVSENAPVQIEGKGEEQELTLPVAPDVVIVVEAEGRVSGDSVRVGPLAARVGAALRLVGPGWEGGATVVKVERDTAATE